MIRHPRVSVVIVSWNSRDLIPAAIDSVLASAIPVEIIVSDNGSVDGSLPYLRETYGDHEITLLANGENLGFSAANNRALAAARGEYVLLLNPDAALIEDALSVLVSYADQHPGAGGFGLQVVGPDGRYQVSARPFPSVRRIFQAAAGFSWLGVLGDQWCADHYVGWRGDTEKEVDWHSGCCLLFRTEVLQQSGGFDPQFFYQFDEVDLCRRIRDLGYSLRVVPGAKVMHVGGGTLSGNQAVYRIEAFRNRFRYFYKFGGEKSVKACRRATLLYVFCRWLFHGMFSLAGFAGHAMEHDLAGRCLRWLRLVDPVALVLQGEEPDIGVAPLVSHEKVMQRHREWQASMKAVTPVHAG